MDEKKLLEDFKDEYYSGWDLIDYRDKGEGEVSQLESFMETGIEAIDDFKEEIYQNSLEYIWEVAEASVKEFFAQNNINPEEVSEETKEEMRMFIEGNANTNISSLFDFPVLLIDDRYTTPVSYSWSENDEDVQDGVMIPEDVSEYKKWKKEAIKYIGKDGFKDVLINSTYGGNAFIGAIVSGSDIVDNILSGADVVSGEPIIGIEDKWNGSGYYTNGNGDHAILLENSHLSTGEYSIGAVFGTNEWKY